MNITFVIGFLSGLIFLVITLIIIVYLRKKRLHKFYFKIHGPSVPDNVLDQVRSAEILFYNELDFGRKLLEDLQDIIGFLWPSMVFRLNFSVGVYRIKAKTIEELMQYALDNKYIDISLPKNKKYRYLLAYFSLQPLLSEWQASLLLQSLKDQHSKLKNYSWADIAKDKKLIAKLYSGYMGAGGDWELWHKDLKPGKVAHYRLGLNKNEK